MAEISASTVMELRQRTGLGMMECKKALAETSGDLAKAEELLRIKSGAKAAESGKPATIVERMVEGAVAKYLSEVTLTAQPFVKGDGKETVGALLKSKGATVNGFTLYVVGEGIEKKKDDFAAEVATMSRMTQ